MRVVLAAWFALVFGASVFAQSPTGTIGGIVFDADARTIPGAEIIVINDLTRVQYESKTNDAGIYAVPNLPPGPYRVQASRAGFKTLIKPDIILNVQDAITVNFMLPIGAASIAVTVEGGAPMINTTDASVSTVVDRQFAENLPLNGRSFQTLIYLTPGVVATSSSVVESGQFSVNGQRTGSNYWMVDGVAANIGVGTLGVPGNGFGGAVGGFSVTGGTNSLVSVDALQEFRIDTSTYSPEFGRTPGAQISIVTRPGTNQYHGTGFDYLRNGALDAKDWFADYNNLPKPAERQNDFGGTLGGPIRRDRAFFFFSYEGLRLELPHTEETSVPDLISRQKANPVMQPYFNAFPVPNGAEIGNGLAAFNASFSDRSTLDAYSLRIDYRLNDRVSLFGRYSYSPSELTQRGSGVSLNTVSPSRITMQTATAGVTWRVSSATSNDLRFNYSTTYASGRYYLDDFGGAVPLNALPLTSPYTMSNAEFGFEIFGGSGTQFEIGSFGRNVQRQINVVEGLTAQRGQHSLKFGADYRRLAPSSDRSLGGEQTNAWYHQLNVFPNVSGAEQGFLLAGVVAAATNSTFQFQNLGIYAQDTWRLTPKLTVTYGLRWDLDFSPSSLKGPNIPRVSSFDDPTKLALLPGQRAPFDTTYGNLAPRLGVDYEFGGRANWTSVVRGGFGVFYDLVSSEVGNAIEGFYPFGATNLFFGATFPLSPALAALPAIVPAQLATPGAAFSGFDPHLKLPYTLEWNLAFEQALGSEQSVSVTYVGASGRRLLSTAVVLSPNPDFNQVHLTGNSGTSNYNALQVQFQRRLSRGLQILGSYTWAHSIDTGSAGQAEDVNAILGASANRGPSDFDVRNAFSSGLTYEIAGIRRNVAFKVLTNGWSVESTIIARSALPVNVYDSAFLSVSEAGTEVRPDVVPGQPLYLSGSKYPGGRAFNPAGFSLPATDANGNPVRQGNLGRNALRGFAAGQWDLGVHRDFRIREGLKLQFRAEMFNILNHPNFGAPIGDLANTAQFGMSTESLAQKLSGGNLGGGGFSPLYQIGGPRSIQLALKLSF